MTIQRDTLFSIHNEALKKERKYSLFFMRIGIIPYFLGYIGYSFLVFVFIFRNVYPSYDSLASFFNNFSLYPFLFAIGYIALVSLPFFFFVRGLWRMQLWIYDLLLIPLLLNIFSLLPLFLIIPLIAAWRVRSFLRIHPHETGKNILGIDTRDIFEFYKESILATKKNTLFSIKSEELRRKCPISLFILRIYVILLSLISVFVCFTLTDIGNSTFVPLLGLFAMYATLGIAFLFLWHLFQLNIYLYSFLGIVSSPFILLGAINIGILCTSFFILAGTIAAWRVHICLCTLQKQDEHDQEASVQEQDEQEVTEQKQDEQEVNMNKKR